MISKSTTADLLKMYYKLEEFFSQQFKSSKRVFTSLEPRLNNNRNSNSITAKQRKRTISTDNNCTTKEWDDAHHHRHWQKPLNQVSWYIIKAIKKYLSIVIIHFRQWV